eukprot:TRINITY_DN54771_c0_g1_i1.p1 TRINITY_DN54771_c0_g1~~TRINITY_DN54771_c0_g1_i1.p1  ORF type:complete len:1177 (-),score=298.62 TRINITY_DN54771_c0_g1_i1:178-3618(-)
MVAVDVDSPVEAEEAKEAPSAVPACASTDADTAVDVQQTTENAEVAKADAAPKATEVMDVDQISEEEAEKSKTVEPVPEVRDLEDDDSVVAVEVVRKSAPTVEVSITAEDDDEDMAEPASQMDEPQKEKEPEEAKELELDEPEDTTACGQPRIAPGIANFALGGADATLNVLTSDNGRVFTSLTDSGLQHFLAATRANVGLKAGRYFYEVRVVQVRNPTDGGGDQRTRTHAPRQLLRIGFSTTDSSLFLGSVDSTVGFDSDGLFYSGKTCTRVVHRLFPYSQVFGVMLNLNPDSPNANTISLFRDGVRVSSPQKLPDCLVGKTLFPTLNYKNMVLHVNLGPVQLASMPFRCLTVQEAFEDHTELNKDRGRLLDGKHEILVPVGLPDEGTFDWLDGFLADHPEYTEISDRFILNWAEKSGIPRGKGYGWRRCNDRPGMDSGIRELDDSNVKQLLLAVAPALPRSYAVMEVRNNLLAAGRRAALEAFSGTRFRKVAMVVMGDPDESFKKRTVAALLLKKREKAIAEAKKQFAEDKKEDGNSELLQEALKKAQEVELTEEEKEVSFIKGDAEDLTKRDLAACFTRFTLPELAEGFDEVRYAWADQEGCDEHLKQWLCDKKLTQRVEDLTPGSWFKTILDEWHDLLHAWRRRHCDWKESGSSRRKALVAARKSSASQKRQREENEDGEEQVPQKASRSKSSPSEEKQADDEAKKKDNNTADDEAKKQENGATEDKKEKIDEEKADDDAEEDTMKKSEAAEPQEAETKESEKDGKADVADGEGKKVEAEDVDKAEDKEAEEAKEDDFEDTAMEDVDEPDVFSVEDVCNIGNGEPLFANFAYEDWALLSLRFELHLLVHAFRRDINDPERPSFHESHVEFYYYKYFKRDLHITQYGVDTMKDLLRLVEDTVEANPKNSVLITHLSDDTPMDNFVRLTEDGRRERQEAIVAGDESAVLKFVKAQPAVQGGRPQTQSYQHGRGDTTTGSNYQQSFRGNPGAPPLSRHGGAGNSRGPLLQPVGATGSRGLPPLTTSSTYSSGGGGGYRAGSSVGSRGSTSGGYHGGAADVRGATLSRGPGAPLRNAFANSHTSSVALVSGGNQGQKRTYGQGAATSHGSSTYGGGEGGAAPYKQSRTSSSASYGGGGSRGGYSRR